MKIARTIGEMRAARGSLDEALAFVPTMGALHAGHLSLVRLARQQSSRIAASVFVNPTQFNDTGDFSRYPRTLDRDVEMLGDAGCDVVFAPNAAVLYPDEFATKIDVGPVAQPLEGAMRPGHFAGVAIVVAKLFNIVRPTHAVFGQKDAQQLAVIRRLVRDLDMPIEIIVGPTVREDDGLAMSSRNALLGPDDRAAAPVLWRALSAARDAHVAGERDADALRQLMKGLLGNEPRAAVEYVSIADPDTLRELETVTHKGAIASLAVRFGVVRLIDNVLLRGFAVAEC